MVSDIKGQVFVNFGEGFVAIETPTEVKPGDRVVARKASGATVRYGNDCEIRLSSGQAFVVPQDKVCPVASLKDIPEESTVSLKDGVAAEETDLTPIILIGAAAGAVGVITLKDDKPASP